NKTPDEPYRIFTSCAEYRLILRQDNADERLMKYGSKFGLIPDDIYKDVVERQELVKEAIGYFKSTYVSPSDVNSYLSSVGSQELKQSDSLSQLIKRNETKLQDFLETDYFNENMLVDELKSNIDAMNEIEIELRYEGYIQRQIEQAESFNQVEGIEIPEDFDFGKIKSLSTEGREKLSKVRPRSIGQASRIAGVSPADVSILTVYIKG
ncbi:MAG: tRNA uridine-5-carboxymethylaminomethyl(34) synthesis enzyme MnmG, partial [Chlorobi bacterium]|nr:tRNA uridine-5-carboxymethylaminomethyl(34) synthesis enzyme MnmG [Chlorobiota bacterium]